MIIKDKMKGIYAFYHPNMSMINLNFFNVRTNAKSPIYSMWIFFPLAYTHTHTHTFLSPFVSHTFVQDTKLLLL
jgi:hypothetical protein